MADDDKLISTDYKSDLIHTFLGYADRSHRLPINESLNIRTMGAAIRTKGYPFIKELDRLEKLISKISVNDIRRDKSLLGNYDSVKLAEEIIKSKIKVNSKETERLVNLAEQSNTIRNLPRERKVRDSGSIFGTKDSSEFFIRLQSLANMLEKIRDDSCNLRRSLVNRDTLESDPEYCINEYIVRQLKSTSKLDVSFISLYSLIAFRLYDKWTILTYEHYRRLIELVRTYSNLSVMMSDAKLNTDVPSAIGDLMKLGTTIACYDPDFIGESIKASRQLFIYDLEVDHIMSKNPKKDFLSTLDEDRKEYAREAYAVISSLTTDKLLRVNIANLYKSYPHPDTNLSKVFDNIKGFKSPNKADKKLLSRFESTVRRSLYKSLSLSKYDVRVEGRSDLANESNRTTVDRNKLSKRSYIEWGQVRFSVLRDLPRAGDLDVTPSDKASATAVKLSEREMEQIRKYSIDGIYKPIFSEKLKNVNDVLSSLSGESELGGKESIRKFNSLIKVHETFESKYIKKGIDIDDIPSDELSNFVMEFESARTNVSTEPKYGEFHKRYTRMFYIAQQSIKSITQRAERLARLVSRKQTGVSIVKGYEASRRDLEKFCHAVAGSSSTSRPVFISFDLSEFSKKYPMELVRIYGKVLSELTGEAWLSRLDLVFRSAMVFNNSRGYFEYTSGVLGGFEGFLNFIWSSSHAVIMEIALESIGLSGELLTFSDDGLLYFMVPDDYDKEKIIHLVSTIQKVYSKFGLEFNLKKTIVSSEIWEYLGNVCFDGKLIDMSIKEVSTIGKVKRSGGLVTTSDNINRLIGQSRSLIKSGFSPNKSYFFMHYYSSLKITRMDTSLSNNSLESMFITPWSCGGFRIPSSIEMCSSSMISADAEYASDLELYNGTAVAGLSMSIVESNLAPSNDSINSIILGSRLKTTGIKTSGISVCNLMIDEIQSLSNAIVAKNPITAKVKRSLADMIKCYVDIDPVLIRSFIESLTPWVDYTKSLALVKSRAARRILGSSRIKYYQAMETKFVKSALKIWRESSPVTKSSYGFFDKMSKKFLRGYNLLPMKPSFRSCFVKVRKKEEDIIGISVIIKIDKDKSAFSQEYIEPSLKFPRRYSTTGWLMEDNSVKEIASARKILDVVAGIISHNPELYDFFTNLTLLFGLELPNIPAGLMGNQSRRSASKSTDTSLFIPKMMLARSSSRYLGHLADYVFDLKTADRMTYLELARVNAAIDYDSNLNTKNGDFSAKYQIKDFERDIMFNNRYARQIEKYKLNVDKPLKKMGDMMNKEFIASYLEHSNARRTEELIDSYIYKRMEVDSMENMVYTSMRRQSLTKWITSIAIGSKDTLTPDRGISVSLVQKYDDIRYAILIGVYLSLDQFHRKRVSSFFIGERMSEYAASSLITNSARNEYDFDDDYDDNDYGDTADIIDERIDVPDNVDLYISRVNLMIDSLIELNDDIFPSNMFDDLRGYTGNNYSPLVDYLLERNLLNNSNIHIVRPMTTAAGKISENYQKLYNEVYTNTLTTLYAIANKLRWNITKIRDVFPTVENIDMILDYISVARAYLRSSSHRSVDKPVNKTTESICLLKFYRLIEYNVDRVIDDLQYMTEDNLEEMLSEFDPIMDVDNNIVAELNASFPNVGEDHAKLIPERLNDRVKASVMSNVKFILRNSFRMISEGRNLDLRRKSLSDVISIGSTFYVKFISVITKRVIEVPEQFSMILEESDASSQLLTSVKILDTPIHLSGEVTRLCNEPTAVRNVVVGMISNYATKTGIDGFRSATDEDTTARMSKAGFYSESGESLSISILGNDNVIRNNGSLSITIITTESATKSRENLLLLSSTDDTNGVITSFKLRNKYYVIMLSRCQINLLINDVDLYDDLDEDINLYKSLTPKREIDRVRIDVNSFISVSDLTRLGNMPAVSSFSKGSTHSSGCPISDPNLIAAFVISKSDEIGNKLLREYCLIYASINRLNLEQAINDIKQYYVSIKEDERLESGFRNDMSMVDSWLRNANFTASIKANDVSIMAALRATDRLIGNPQRIANVNTIYTSAKALPLNRIYTGDARIGNISSKLFETNIVVNNQFMW